MIYDSQPQSSLDVQYRFTPIVDSPLQRALAYIYPLITYRLGTPVRGPIGSGLGCFQGFALFNFRGHFLFGTWNLVIMDHMIT